MGIGSFFKKKTLAGKLHQKKRKALGLKSKKVKAVEQKKRPVRKLPTRTARTPKKVANAGRMRTAAKKQASRAGKARGRPRANTTRRSKK